jgi:hypothetical protein
MSVSLCAKNVAICLAAILAAGTAFGRGFGVQGGEYQPGGLLPGDQINPQLALKSSGGYLVWEDNIADGDGQGISALALDGNLSGLFSSFRVNQNGVGHQERPQVSLLNGGGAVFVWHGAQSGRKHIYARFLSPTNTWITGDILVNTYTNTFQHNPVVATLTGGNVAIVWSSFNQLNSTSMEDIYAQILSPTGQKVGGEFLVNQTTNYNQRTPALAALSGGGFVVAWISELQRAELSVDLYARLFNSSGTATSSELLVNTSTNVCANPSMAAAPSGGGFVIAWGERDLQVRTNGWDVYSRPFSGAGIPGAVQMLNTYRFNDQFAPKISALPSGYLAVWTSMGQDGSGEGVYGQVLDANGALSGAEFRVNTTTASRQIQPSVTADGSDRFLVSWSSFTGSAHGMDLFAQRYALATQPLSPPSTPFVNVLSSNALNVAWQPVAGLNLSYYEVYADGAASATVTTTNCWCDVTGLAPSSTHYFQVDYVLSDGRRSPLSLATTNTTYDMLTWGGIPYDWMVRYFGSDVSKWPSASADTDGDGASTLNEFLAGTDPTSGASSLKTTLQRSGSGFYLNWNTVAGLVYQVQSSANLTAWTNVGGPRFAAGSGDSMFVGGTPASYYRVLRLR